ncbi:MAG: PrsW family intramembrane metalloprotease, partial [Bacteroidota bacterium]
EMNQSMIHDFLYFSIKVGAVEELAKVLPFLVFLIFFSKQVNEPIDFLFYGCTGALGFAAVENTLYFSNHGAIIISLRAVLSTLGHMMWTGLICYGIVRYRYTNQRFGTISILGYFLLASFSHGFFNFWIAFKAFGGYGFFVTLMYFLIGVSVFVGILNNAVNNSTFFTYHKVIHSSLVARRLFTHVGIVFLLQFTAFSIENGFLSALGNLYGQVFFFGLVIMVVIFRLSRFTLIHNTWEPLPIELPFRIYHSGKRGKTSIGVGGSAFDDVLARGYFQAHCRIIPLSKRRTYLKDEAIVVPRKKFFLSEDEPAYIAELKSGGTGLKQREVLLAAKSSGVTQRGKYPILGIYEIKKEIDRNEPRQPDENFRFLEWGYLELIEDVS